jgi:hypothetical protein
MEERDGSTGGPDLIVMHGLRLCTGCSKQVFPPSPFAQWCGGSRLIYGPRADLVPRVDVRLGLDERHQCLRLPLARRPVQGRPAPILGQGSVEGSRPPRDAE